MLQIESDGAWRIVFPFVIFGATALIMHTKLIPESMKGIMGIVAFLVIYFSRVSCQARTASTRNLSTRTIHTTTRAKSKVQHES